MSGAVLDAGALIAFERGARTTVALVARALELGARLTVPAGVVGLVEVVPLSDAQSRAAGQLCGVTKTRDVIDASVVLCARDRKVCVVTSDLEDLRRLAPELELIHP